MAMAAASPSLQMHPPAILDSSSSSSSPSPPACHLHPFPSSSLSSHCLTKNLSLRSKPFKTPFSSSSPCHRPFFPIATASSPAQGKTFHGQCFVVNDNIDTDQIIPAEYLTLVPSKPEEYEKLGSYAMIGLPSQYGRFVEEGQTKTRYSIVIAGANFGCGSSREHAPVALGAAGVQVVIAESYARIFFRNSVATGELYPLESEGSLSKECRTGDYITVDMGRNVLINHTQNSQYALKPIGDAGPVIDAGGIFAYARKTGMIAASTA